MSYWCRLTIVKFDCPSVHNTLFDQEQDFSVTMSDATLPWEIQCKKCFSTRRYTIARHDTTSLKELVQGYVLCTSCSGRMELRSHQKDHFRRVYGEILKKMKVKL